MWMPGPGQQNGLDDGNGGASGTEGIGGSKEPLSRWFRKWSKGLFVCSRFELQGGRVDAVTQAGLISRPVGEEMAQVTATGAATYLSALHAVAIILVGDDMALVDDVPEAGPARARRELGPGGK